MTLILKLDRVNMYLHTKNEIPRFSGSKFKAWTDTQTDAQIPRQIWLKLLPIRIRGWYKMLLVTWWLSSLLQNPVIEKSILLTSSVKFSFRIQAGHGHFCPWRKVPHILQFQRLWILILWQNGKAFSKQYLEKASRRHLNWINQCFWCITCFIPCLNTKGKCLSTPCATVCAKSLYSSKKQKTEGEETTKQMGSLSTSELWVAHNDKINQSISLSKEI